jgi:folylpolyglutamate synthase/dihydropteroate synthase
MIIFIQHDAPPQLSVRRALDTLVKAGIYSAEGGGSINDRPLIIIDAAHGPEAIAALSKAGMRPVIG